MPPKGDESSEPLVTHGRDPVESHGRGSFAESIIAFRSFRSSVSHRNGFLS